MQVRLDERLPPSPQQERAAAAAGIHIAIVCMSKQPLDLVGWLEYHRQLGVEHFFLRVEDSPEISQVLDDYRFPCIVHRTFATNTARDYVKQTSRQNAHVAQVIPQARRHGITHILHIDDDELLYCAGGMDELKAELARITDLYVCDFHLANIEALASSPTDPATSVFRRGGVRAFRHDMRQYCAYVNGKSFGRVAAPRLRSHGPHGFYCDGANERHAIPPFRGVILHFESVTVASWKLKFGDLARTHAGEADADEKLPRYYRESVRANAALLAARAKGDAIAVEVARQGAVALWKRWKLWPPAAGYSAAAAAARAQVEATRAPQVLEAEGVTLIWMEPCDVAVDRGRGGHSGESILSSSRPREDTPSIEEAMAVPSPDASSVQMPLGRSFVPSETSALSCGKSASTTSTCGASVGGTSQAWRRRRQRS